MSALSPILGQALRPLVLAIGSALAGDHYVSILDEQTAEPASFVDFTRASTATRYNSAGLLETVAASAPRIDYDPATVTRANYALYSEQFDNAAWAKNTGAIIADFAPAPDGSQTADKLVAVTSNTQHWVYRINVPGGVAGQSVTYSVYMKADGYRYAQLRILSAGTAANVGFDLQTGTVYGTAAGSGSITSAGNGWYRCEVTGTLSGALADLYINVNNRNVLTTSFSGDGVGGILIWGVQLERGSTATAYIATGVLERGNDLFSDADVSFVGASSRVSPGVYRILSDGTYSLVRIADNLVIGRSYEVQYTVDSVAVAGNGLSNEPNSIPIPSTVGTHRTQFVATAASWGIKRASTAVDLQISGVAIREINNDYASPRGNATLRGLLVEEQRTNLLLRSQEFDNASWSKIESTVTVNAAVAPDGALTADKIVENTAVAAQHRVNQSHASAVIGTTYSFSVYAKAGERTKVGLRIIGAATFAVALFDLQAGTFSGVSAGSASIQNVGGGWFRCSISGVADATTIISYANLEVIGNYDGDGVSGLFLWGAQLEAGTFATSYIQTAGTAQTRAADLSTTTVPVGGLAVNEIEGTLFAEVVFSKPVGGANQYVVQLDDGTLNNRHLINRQGSNGRIFPTSVVSGVVQQSSVLASTVNDGTPTRIAFAYKANDFAAWDSNGASVVDAAGAVPEGIVRLIIGATNQSGGEALCGHIRRLRYYPRRLTNAQLQALTA